MTATISIPSDLAAKILWNADKPFRPGDYWINTDNHGRQWLYAAGNNGPLATNRLPLSWHDEDYPFMDFAAERFES